MIASCVGLRAMTTKARRGGDRGGRRPQTPIEQKAVISGKVRVRIDPEKEMIIPVDQETRLLAQRLMLNDYPGVETVEQLFAYAVRKLADA